MKKKEKGFSLIELLIVVVVIGIIAAIAVPNLLSARRSANEGSAIAAMRTLHGAQLTYSSTAGNGEFAGATSFSVAALQELGTPGARIIDESIDTGVKNGYQFQGIRIARDLVAGTPAQFAFSGRPSATSGATQTGTRRFGIATEGMIVADQTLAHFTTLLGVQQGTPLQP